MIEKLLQRAHEYFQQHLDVSLDALIAPIDASMPAGKSVRGNGVYSAIEQARRKDDASLPMGAWEHDLKRADWDKVSVVAVNALAHKSKDLQLAGWLLEAQINKTGFAGIAACMVLINSLCERYWDDMYPQPENGDLEYRANIIHWVNEKLLAAVRMVPLTATGQDHSFTWADWEQARRNEQVRATMSQRDQDTIEGATLKEMAAAMSATSTDAYNWLHQMLTESLEAMEILGKTLDRLFGTDAPSLSTLYDLLDQIRLLAESELHKRGVRPAPPLEIQASEGTLPVTTNESDPLTIHKNEGVYRDGGKALTDAAAGNCPVRDRADAYARLTEAAEFLMQIEPHSPAPYLVVRAIEWGRMNTAELYQELFLRLGGQLNIFHMLGLEAAGDPASS